ncbi:hypothetical protein [Pseudomonas siliginis]|uniref:hypothetical protein n=1 Tax=Pseudomonas siliginis TaxID=2842346 RepID=UPI00209386EE|nr:hypothetical protein [Pseudomonas siliginis]UST96767.1 hypothetical protein NF679_06575 [Pseudomonas siliginis]
MNKAVLLLVPVLLSSCSTIQHKPVQITPHTVEFHGAKNAISPAASGTPMSEYPSNGQPRATPYEEVFPLSYAVECNAGRTACKHAVVQTGLTYEIHEVGSEVEITGNLKSTMGRKLTQRVGDQNGSYHQTSLSVSDDVEVIGTGTVIKSFSFIYRPGKRVVVDGLGGVQVIITFDPSKKPSV